MPNHNEKGEEKIMGVSVKGLTTLFLSRSFLLTVSHVHTHSRPIARPPAKLHWATTAIEIAKLTIRRSTHTHTNADTLKHKTLLNARRTALHSSDSPAWNQQRQRQTDRQRCERQSRESDSWVFDWQDRLLTLGVIIKVGGRGLGVREYRNTMETWGRWGRNLGFNRYEI